MRRSKGLKLDGPRIGNGKARVQKDLKLCLVGGLVPQLFFTKIMTWQHCIVYQCSTEGQTNCFNKWEHKSDASWPITDLETKLSAIPCSDTLDSSEVLVSGAELHLS